MRALGNVFARLGWAVAGAILLAVLVIGGCSRPADPNAPPIIRSAAAYEETRQEAWQLAREGLVASETGEELTPKQLYDLGEALRLFRGLVAFQPSNFGPHYGAAKIAHALGSTEEARRSYEQALRLASGSPSLEAKQVVADAHDSLSRLALIDGELKIAEDQARLAVAMEPENPNYQASLVSALVQAKKLDEARRVLAAASKLDPTNRRLIALRKLLDD